MKLTKEIIKKIIKEEMSEIEEDMGTFDNKNQLEDQVEKAIQIINSSKGIEQEDRLMITGLLTQLKGE